MLVYAWVILTLSITSLINLIVNIFKKSSDGFRGFDELFSVVLWILGCLWYIFDLTILPYEILIGMAVGGTARFLITSIGVNMFWGRHILLFFHIEDFTLFAATPFFVLAAVQHVWPHLITF